jgi:carboxymethylenebutenolidase
MDRKKATDFPQELLYLFENYAHGMISRREFLDRAKQFAVGGLTAAAILESLEPNWAMAQLVPEKDTRLKTEYAVAPSPKGNGSINGYLARPANATGKLPGVLIIHGASGLNPHIEDVARRFGLENFMAYAPDGSTSVGGNVGGDRASGEAQLRKVDPAKLTEDFVAAAGWLKARNDCTGRIAVVGYCFGGGVANTLAVRMPDLSAAVPYYGTPPEAADVAKIKAAVLVHHGELDTRLMATWPAYEAALKANKIRYEGYTYPNANHNFNQDTDVRYNEPAAKLAWQRTVAFLNKYLRES